MFNFDRPLEDVLLILASFVIAVTIHEYMHAWTAHKLGDDTARRLGRITFNPVEHFDPFGFLGMVMIAFGIPFIGWGKPVPVQPGNFRGKWSRNRKEGMLLVAAAGPLSNIAQAGVAAIILHTLLRSGTGNEQVYKVLTTFLQINCLLAAFNMIPFPPLDGYKILTGILPRFWTPILQPLEQYGFMVLLMFVFIGRSVGGGSVLQTMYAPPFNALMDLFFYRFL